MRTLCLNRRVTNVQTLVRCVRRFSDKAGQKNDINQVTKFAENKADRVFSGIQPTGVPHLGNYVGAIKNWVELQRRYNSVVISIVDLHSISVKQDPKVLRENIFEMAASLIACGVDPNHSILFQQSTVVEHAYLSWILGCLCTLPRLNHLPQWRDKSKKVKDPGLGLFTYPVLQSADILLYKSTLVPVGEDQLTHIELARDLAKYFNRDYGVVFPECSPLIGNQTKLNSLRDPTSKMSKSERSPMGRIDLNDSPDVIANKIKKAVTDSELSISYDRKNRPGVANLLDTHSAITGVSVSDLVNQYADLNKVEYKKVLTDVVNEHVQPIREEMARLLDDRHELAKILHKGQEQASAIAQETIKEVNQVVGFR